MPIEKKGIYFRMMNQDEHARIGNSGIRDFNDESSGRLEMKRVQFGLHCSDRAAWERAGKHPSLKGIVAEATEVLNQTIAPLTSELYGELWSQGSATGWNRNMASRQQRLRKLVLAEGAEGMGRFLSAIESEIGALCDALSWVSPSHDWKFENRDGVRITIDLEAAMTGWSLATAEGILSGVMSAGTSRRIREETARRIFQPYFEAVEQDPPGLWWMTTSNNWNAVCHAGVVGSGLALLDSEKDRARLVDSALQNLQHYLNGFSEDGASSEGLMYWNYGFSHYLFLTELLDSSTNGDMNLLAGERLRNIAKFGPRMEMMNGWYPAFSDCAVHSRPDAWTVQRLNQRLGLGLSGRDSESEDQFGWVDYQLYSAAMMLFAKPLPELKNIAGDRSRVRDWFPHRQIYIGRSPKMAVGIKGGHNAEHHNHNDLGSFTVMLEGVPLVLDLGREIYHKDSFGAKRYESVANNSYGHPVPVVAGQLQRPGAEAATVVEGVFFSEQEDRVVFDLKGAYEVPALISLKRRFTFSRVENPSFEVEDHAVFSEPSTFAGAVLTLAQCHEVEGGMEFFQGYQRLGMEVQTEADFEVEALNLNLDGGGSPLRVGIRFKNPSTEFRVRLRFIQR